MQFQYCNRFRNSVTVNNLIQGLNPETKHVSTPCLFGISVRVITANKMFTQVPGNPD